MCPGDVLLTEAEVPVTGVVAQGCWQHILPEVSDLLAP